MYESLIVSTWRNMFFRGNKRASLYYIFVWQSHVFVPYLICTLYFPWLFFVFVFVPLLFVLHIHIRVVFVFVSKTLPCARRICPSVHQKSCRSGPTSQRAQEGCRSVQGRWTRQSWKKKRFRRNIIYSTDTSSETRKDIGPKTWSYLREENSCGFKHFRGGSPIFQVFCHRLWQHLVDQLFRPENGIAECWLLIPHLFFCFFKSISLARRAKDRIWRAFTAFLRTDNTDHVTYFW